MRLFGHSALHSATNWPQGAELWLLQTPFCTVTNCISKRTYILLLLSLKISDASRNLEFCRKILNKLNVIITLLSLLLLFSCLRMPADNQDNPLTSRTCLKELMTKYKIEGKWKENRSSSLWQCALDFPFLVPFLGWDKCCCYFRLRWSNRTDLIPDAGTRIPLRFFFHSLCSVKHALERGCADVRWGSDSSSVLLSSPISWKRSALK